MGKIKIHEIAKKLDLTSKEVLEMAEKLKIEVKSHLSGVDEEQAKQIELALTKKDNTKKENKKKRRESTCHYKERSYY